MPDLHRFKPISQIHLFLSVRKNRSDIYALEKQAGTDPVHIRAMKIL